MNHATPDSHNVALDFDSEVHTPTNPHNVVLDFGASASTTQSIRVGGIDSSTYGQVVAKGSRTLFPIGFIATSFGEQELITDILIEPTGFDESFVYSPNVWNFNKEIEVFGFDESFVDSPNVWNFNKKIEVFGFDESSVGTPSKVYNLRQYIQDVGGDDATSYGAAYIQGGVKYIDLNNLDFDAAQYGLATVINTKADQFVNLVDEGITPQEMPSPDVSPRIIYAKSQVATLWGNALVQFPPRPKGFVATSYGVAWVSHSPRYLEPNYIDTFNSGYPKVFDPTQKIYVTGVNTVIAGGIFGDISAKNTRRIIKVSGLYAQSFSDWGVVESNRRAIGIKGFDSRSFGTTNIYNKTPSIAPIGIYSFDGLNSTIGYRIRTVKPSGWYQPKLGNHTLTKSPEIEPVGIHQNDFGSTWVSNKTRSIYAGLGRESLAIGEITVWHFTRRLKSTGIFEDGYGTPRVEHGRRTILANGSIHSVYGDNAWVSYAVRSLSPSSITYPNIPIHRVGGTQHIQPFGYVATLFGSRIIPESQSIYPQGFINPFGLTIVDLWKKYIKPNGFLTTGQEGGHRFGTHKFWNLRQYIEMYYDVDSGLTPPKWTGWTSIENRNKTIGAIGSNSARISEPNIENKARVLSPSGLSTLTFGQAMIAERVRSLKLQGMEAPYISGWSAIYNAAFVIAQKGFKADTFGVASILNTRRYFNRIGNFESLEMGTPMIADRIRTLKFEQRYTIAPPYIPIHRIDLYTRYIEEVGRSNDHQAFGNPSLSIHWNIITPRWTMRDAYGSPTLKNVTPELGTRGHNSEEFGQTNIRTQWRELLHLGSETVVWGRSEIAFRDRQFSVDGFTQWNIPTHKVTKTGVPPYYPQYIWLDSVEIDGEQNDGHGIEMPDKQVPTPNIKTNMIYPVGFVASLYGSHHIQSNGILVQPGLQELTVGEPLVSLKNRSISVTSIASAIAFGSIRLSPWTIWATTDTPDQAIENHEGGRFYPINSNQGLRRPGEVFGNSVISLKIREPLSVGLGDQSDFGNGHKIDLRRRYINLKDFGFRSQRIGVHVLGPFDQNVTQFDSNDMQSFGQPSLSNPYGGAFYIEPNAIVSPTINMPTVDFFNRTIKPVGSNHLQMGTEKGDDTPFMWQGLRVGELVKGNYGGFDNLQFGELTWISNKIRELSVNGFESFVCEYDYTAFDKRMRVIRKDLPKPSLSIQPVGVDALVVTVPNIKPAVHYIRPDGNADQYRKGAF